MCDPQARSDLRALWLQGDWTRHGGRWPLLLLRPLRARSGRRSARPRPRRYADLSRRSIAYNQYCVLIVKPVYPRCRKYRCRTEVGERRELESEEARLGPPAPLRRRAVGPHFKVKPIRDFICIKSV